ncbi:hypothetical protein SAMN05421759_11860 [Roseivivax lentus]|uniref:Small multidrug resistance family-3 protein n=1 Tax=Roseivivax lentus TaxID=633194 RepID=A0A1N7PQ53_9RHOB|nr:hypothetical protein [Roseivivax lentus]SIT12665.1 hypothetical protein SAMN05421759_11860 [Roseivivax lentus]
MAIPLIVLASAGFYCIAMIAMKSWWVGPSPWILIAIAGALLIAGAFEVLALKQERLGIVYVGILGAEVLIIGTVSILLFGESFTAREVAGIALVLVGTALAWA